jgi:squalene cyclase
MEAFFILSLVMALAVPSIEDAPGRELSARRETQTDAESRAVAYLAREVPRWFRENKCYSCHNNGVAARALYTAVRLSLPVPPKALDDTSRWLLQPQQWHHNGGEGPFSDKKLACIQFAAALVDALGSGRVNDRQALIRAADLVVEYQEKDGSWQVDAPGTIGSPTTYGACLATCQAGHVLRRAGAARYRTAIAKAEHWLCERAVGSVLDAAAVLLALAASKDVGASAQERHCLMLIRKGESENGGWGPYVRSPPEAFDTAIVLLALRRYAEREPVESMIKRGRAYLVSTQQHDGSWPETTRPPGAESYAQRVSTTAWATLALLGTR